MRTRILALGAAVCALAVPGPLAAADASIPLWAANKDEQLPRHRADHLAYLGVPAWHDAGLRGKGVKVAVIDSGFRGYRTQIGKTLPAGLVARSARQDGNMEAKDSQHGILCGEVVHAIAPDADVLFANWDADNPDSFLDAVRWAKAQGAQIVSCSVVMPSWSDGEGNGPIHKKLSEIIGDGTKPGDVLFFSCAGNMARRAWGGTFTPAADGYHQWAANVVANPVSPWGDDRVSLEVCWSDPAARYRLEVIDPETGKPADGCTYRDQTDPPATTARIVPKPGRSYAVRMRQTEGKPGTFHFSSLAAYIGEVKNVGSIPFPGDGPEVVTVGATTLDGKRASFSACGPNSCRPKPDVAAPIPFDTFLRPTPFSGTSCATPQAAAVGALCWSANPTWGAAKVRAYLAASARDLGPAGHDCETGFGSVHLPGVATVRK